MESLDSFHGNPLAKIVRPHRSSIIYGRVLHGGADLWWVAPVFHLIMDGLGVDAEQMDAS